MAKKSGVLIVAGNRGGELGMDVGDVQVSQAKNEEQGAVEAVATTQ